MIRDLAREEVNIVTLEDPVEYHIPGVSQCQINEKTGMTFANGLRSILRQDPDIIMIGEIRDEETAEIAVQASITGHLVVSTLHTNSAAGTITRMLNMGVEGYLLADSVIGVIAQRLVRRLCPNCKQPHKPTEYERKLLNLDDLDETMIFEAKGCPMCANTGYKGKYPKSSVLKKLEVGNRNIRDDYVNHCHWRGKRIPSIERRRYAELMLLFTP